MRTNLVSLHGGVVPFDIHRYMGLWYEIARYNHLFERNLVGVKAFYTLQDNGNVEVINMGHVGSLDGSIKSAIGKAKLTGNGNVGHIRVSFFLNFYADYYILSLDQDQYMYALVGSSSDKYLWILSRSPQLDDSIVTFLMGEAVKLGYDVGKLLFVPQRI